MKSLWKRETLTESIDKLFGCNAGNSRDFGFAFGFRLQFKLAQRRFKIIIWFIAAEGADKLADSKEREWTLEEGTSQLLLQAVDTRYICICIFILYLVTTLDAGM